MLFVLGFQARLFYKILLKLWGLWFLHFSNKENNFCTFLKGCLWGLNDIHVKHLKRECQLLFLSSSMFLWAFGKNSTGKTLIKGKNHAFIFPTQRNPSVCTLCQKESSTPRPLLDLIHILLLSLSPEFACYPNTKGTLCLFLLLIN